MFHDQGSAVIMKAHSTWGVYAGCNVQVLKKRSHAEQPRKKRGLGCSGNQEAVPSTSKDRVVGLLRRLLRTLDIPCSEALE